MADKGFVGLLQATAAHILSHSPEERALRSEQESISKLQSDQERMKTLTGLAAGDPANIEPLCVQVGEWIGKGIADRIRERGHLRPSADCSRRHHDRVCVVCALSKAWSELESERDDYRYVIEECSMVRMSCREANWFLVIDADSLPNC